MEIASKLNHLIDENQLAELGKLEQDLVYGDATSKEVIAFLTANQSIPAADKVSGGSGCGSVQVRRGEMWSCLPGDASCPVLPMRQSQTDTATCSSPLLPRCPCPAACRCGC